MDSYIQNNFAGALAYKSVCWLFFLLKAFFMANKHVKPVIAAGYV